VASLTATETLVSGVGKTPFPRECWDVRGLRRSANRVDRVWFFLGVYAAADDSASCPQLIASSIDFKPCARLVPAENPSISAACRGSPIEIGISPRRAGA
jgi:hypothetical protein